MLASQSLADFLRDDALLWLRLEIEAWLRTVDETLEDVVGYGFATHHPEEGFLLTVTCTDDTHYEKTFYPPKIAQE